MKNIYFTILVVVIAFIAYSCIKNKACEDVYPLAEEAAIKAYCIKEGINYTKDTSGVFYEIIEQGQGTLITRDSSIFCARRGTLLNGTVFDSSVNADPWPLALLIPGWQIAIPKINKGGHIKIVIPSIWAYGCSGRGNVPGNAPLYFDIHVLDK